MTWTIMPDYGGYEEAVEEFRWDIPGDYNPVEDLLQKHENPGDRIALIRDYSLESPDEYTFRDIDRLSSSLAAGLADLGVEDGDRVGVVLPQCMENPVSHLAIWKLGAITVPLTVLFGEDALEYRIRDAGISACITWPSKEALLERKKDEIESLHTVISTSDDSNGSTKSFDRLLNNYDSTFEPVAQDLSSPSAIMYTSGSTGPPKGVLHSFGIWLGRAAAHRNFFEQYDVRDTVVWTPADWAWGTALGGTLFGAWHHGTPIVAAPMEGFDAGRAFAIMEEYDVTNAVVPPTGMRMMMEVTEPADEYELSLDTFASAGESLTPEIVDWIQDEFDDVTVNEFYGQTELNLFVGNCSKWFPTKPGSMGKPYPGYEVKILDPASGDPLETGEVGEIAVRPKKREIFFKEYWNRPDATHEKQMDEFFLTGDLARRDDDGYIWFKSRKDDLIITSGYRVGPMEVEKAILEHPVVAEVGVVGVPDAKRGEVIKAFVVRTNDEMDNDNLRNEIEEIVRDRLAEYEYPREIEFVEKLPKTSTGKIRRNELRAREEDSA